eukprot:2190743-Pyramimonas_sp.AAC.1
MKDCEERDEDGEITFEGPRGAPVMSWGHFMRDDAAQKFGDPRVHDDRLAVLSRQLHDGVETELAPIFCKEASEASKYLGRAAGPEYRQSTAGGALARYQPSGTSYSRALRLLGLRVHDVRLALPRGAVALVRA